MSKHEPCSNRIIEQRSSKNTICNVLRNIYHLSDNAEVKLQARIAVTMAKKMDKKLREYKSNWDREFWE